MSLLAARETNDFFICIVNLINLDVILFIKNLYRKNCDFFITKN